MSLHMVVIYLDMHFYCSFLHNISITTLTLVSAIPRIYEQSKEGEPNTDISLSLLVV